jgi:hypothetical protein
LVLRPHNATSVFLLSVTVPTVADAVALAAVVAAALAW